MATRLSIEEYFKLRSKITTTTITTFNNPVLNEKKNMNHQNGFKDNNLQVINTLTIHHNVFLIKMAVIILSALVILGGVVVYQMKDVSSLKIFFF